MNRNELFQTVSGVTMGRSKFDLSHSSGRSFNEGDLVPFLCCEVLPGDTFDVKANGFVRSITPLYPVMDNAKIDTYFFYVRSRNLWDHWKEFCGENNTSAWKQDVKYSIPGRTVGQIVGSALYSKAGLQLNGVTAYSLWSYIGAPPLYKVYWDNSVGDFSHDPLFGTGDMANSDTFCSVLPFRAYRQIWNDFFRNQNVQDPVLVSTSDTAAYWEYTDKNSGEDFSGNGFLKAGRVADYFASVLPQPQRGPAVSLPLVGSAIPVETADVHRPYDSSKAEIRFVAENSAVNTNGSVHAMYSGGRGSDAMIEAATGSAGAQTLSKLQPSNLVINLEQVDAVSINALRLAFATQRWYEALGRGGGRYFEILRSMWGVYSSDAVMQMPEYLGGSSFALSNRQVLQTSGSSDANSSPLGETGAFSLSTGSAGSFVHSFDEHGYLFGLAVLRVERSYSQGMPAFLQRKSFFSFYTPQLAHIGEQQLPKSEIYLTGGSTPLGYKEAWTEYRYLPNNIKGMMDPALKNGFQAWTYGDVYDAPPTLSDGWFKEGMENVDRTLRASAFNPNDSGYGDLPSPDIQQFFGTFFMDIKATRVMPVRSTPGLLDHF